MNAINRAFMAWFLAEVVLFAAGWAIRETTVGLMLIGSAIFYLASWIVWKRSGSLNRMAIALWVVATAGGLISLILLANQQVSNFIVFLTATAVGILTGITFAWLRLKS